MLLYFTKLVLCLAHPSQHVRAQRQQYRRESDPFASLTLLSLEKKGPVLENSVIVLRKTFALFSFLEFVPHFNQQ